MTGSRGKEKGDGRRGRGRGEGERGRGLVLFQHRQICVKVRYLLVEVFNQDDQYPPVDLWQLVDQLLDHIQSLFPITNLCVKCGYT